MFRIPSLKLFSYKHIAVLLLIFGLNTSLIAHNDHDTHEHSEQVEANHDHGNASHDKAEEHEEPTLTESILHHVQDEHKWELPTFTSEPVYLYLPIILYDNGSWVTFSSKLLEHGAVVERGGNYYKMHHEKIYKTDAHGTLHLNEKHEPTNEKPFDFSITKNVLSLFISVILLLIIMLSVSKAYKNRGSEKAPRGLQGFIEPLILYIRDEVAIPNIGRKKYMKFMPFLLTIFFFILINNLLGLVPFFPGGANLSGNLAFTAVLAIATFIVVTINGNKHYWEHILWMPGVPAAIKLILTPVEIVGMFVKPISLAIRLFANITGGHILVLSIVTLGIAFQSYAVGGVSALFTVFIGLIEILVSFLQAFIFTLLSAIYIGDAVAEGDH